MHSICWDEDNDFYILTPDGHRLTSYWNGGCSVIYFEFPSAAEDYCERHGLRYWPYRL